MQKFTDVKNHYSYSLNLNYNLCLECMTFYSHLKKCSELDCYCYGRTHA